MKKYLLLVVVVISFFFNGYSQCTPDVSITQPGIYPDSAVNLPHAYVGVPYTATMQIKAPKDTLFSGLASTVDTIALISFTGFPPGGYTYACNPSTCRFLGGSNGCVSIQGPAPVLAQAGTVYPLTAIIRVSGHANILPNLEIYQNDTLKYYFIQVDNNSAVGMVNGSKFSVTQNHPNPFNKNTFIEFYSPTGGMISLTVSNMLGKPITSKSMWMQQGNNKITLSAKEFEPGIYFYTITTDKQSVTKRMIVDNE